MRPIAHIGFTLSCVAMIIAAGCGRTTPQATGDVSPPSNWPIAGLTLPAGVHDAEFTPGSLREIANRLPRKRPMGSTTRYTPPPPQWNCFFSFTGEPSKVFEHVDRSLVSSKFVPDQIDDLEVGTANESRSHTYISADKRYSVSLRFWKVSEASGSKPYQLLVRDVRTQYEP